MDGMNLWAAEAQTDGEFLQHETRLNHNPIIINTEVKKKSFFLAWHLKI